MGRESKLTAKDLISIDNIAFYIITQPSIWVLVLAMPSIVIAYHKWFGWGLLESALVIAMFFLRSFVEWLIHYYLHHANPLPILRKRLKTTIYYMHIEHHRAPWKSDELFFKGRSMFMMLLLPFLVVSIVSIPLALMAVLLFSICLFFNEVFHAFSHADVSFKNKWLMRVITNHRDHHRVNSQRHFGVSSLLADRFFNTLSDYE